MPACNTCGGELKPDKRAEALQCARGGWVTPHGIYIPCESDDEAYQHPFIAKRYFHREDIMDNERYAEERGWVKVQARLVGDFAWDIRGLGCPTQRQLDCLWDWVMAERDDLKRKMRASAFERFRQMFESVQCSMENLGRPLGIGADFSLLTYDRSNPDFRKYQEQDTSHDDL